MPTGSEAWKFARTLVGALVIAATTAWIYAPALDGGWLWDDDRYITANPLVWHGWGLERIWFRPGSFDDYYPVTESVQWVQWHLWGLNTLGYHATNVALHTASALLVWRLFARLDLKLAWLGGLLFAIHPVQVESVAWISELKNTLSLLPLLLAMNLWLDDDRDPKPWRYGTALGLFLIALLSKISVVFFPFVLLLHAWWKRGRIGATDLKASAPFFALSLGVGLLTVVTGIWDMNLNHLPPEFTLHGGLPARVVLAGLCLAFYLGKVVWPADLLPIYPKWTVDAASPVQYLPWLVLAALLAWCWMGRETWGRHALFGLGFFLINLAPSPGFVPAPNMSYAWVMDHFLYLPVIGLIGLAMAGAQRLGAWLPVSMRWLGLGLAASACLLLALQSRGYAAVFADSQTLWSYTLQRNPDAWAAYNNIGDALLKQGRFDEAIPLFEKALGLNPNYPEALNNLGYALAQKGQTDQAITFYQRALQINPGAADAHDNLGNALFIKGRMDDAMAEYLKSLAIDPGRAEAHSNLGVILYQKGQPDEAIAQYEAALATDPNYANAHSNLGFALLQKGDLDGAMAQYRTALAANPNFPEAHFNLGAALLQQGRVDEAIAELEEALRQRPGYVQAQALLTQAQARQNSGVK